MKLAAEIIVAYLAGRTIDPAELPTLVREVRLAIELRPSDHGGPIRELIAAEVAAPQVADGTLPPTSIATGGMSPPVPAVPIEESVRPDYIVSLEDGKPYRSLRRHLMAKYGLTPDEYRERWGLGKDYPMVAPNYARDRSEVAKRIGLGRRPSTVGVPKKKSSA